MNHRRLPLLLATLLLIGFSAGCSGGGGGGGNGGSSNTGNGNGTGDGNGNGNGGAAGCVWDESTWDGCSWG